MVTKMKKRSATLFTIFLISPMFSQEIKTTILSTVDESNQVLQRGGFIDDEIIFQDSFVFYDEFDSLINNQNFNKIGKYYYENEIGELFKYISSDQDLILNKDTLKVVELPGRGLKFSDGSFIVTFENESKKQLFLQSFILDPVDVLISPYIATYKVNHEDISSFIKLARESENILAAEIQLIDPTISLN